MRKIDYANYREKRRAYIRNKAILGTEKVSSSRPRDKKERQILARLDKLRWEKWLRDGTLTRLGPREYKLSI